MKTPEIKWSSRKERYGASTQVARIGLIVVGDVGWNSCKSKGEQGVDYKWRVALPCLRTKHGYVQTEGDGKSAVEALVATWFNALGETK